MKWSDEDQQYIGTCEEYPSLSYFADTADAAGDGISELAYIARDDIRAGRAGADEHLTQDVLNQVRGRSR
ncbi:hypothetical protein [Mycobacterium palustre]|uniref:Antitoxin HicB n=1 Tax=Mycobacterium palustre TaxID=153971 RepID=A0A1X1ZC62_9MYCO|nr:hypothetical protein [Mycobacterium palustre]MCV7100064.1 hypothetical protein [Mycobacterium palustre]ORW20922.1 hypothetical protein AWC19_14255 [Mycobacterium palustre]